MKRRILQLETTLQDVQASPDAPPEPSATDRPEPPRSTASLLAGTQEPQRSARADPVNNALGQIGFLSLNAMGHSASSARGIAERVACSSLVSEAMSLDGSDPTAPRLDDTKHSRLSNSVLLTGMSGNLDYDATEWTDIIDRFADLASIYIAGIPGLDCFNMFRTFQAAHRTGKLASLLETEPETAVCAKLMLASGICMNGRSASVDLLVCNLIKDIAETVRRLQDSVLVRCLIFRIIFSLYHPSGGSTWSLIGLAMAKAISLGLHREPSQSEVANSLEQHGLFSAIYVLDRTVALAMDRPFAVADSDISIQIQTPPQSVIESSTPIATEIALLRGCIIQHSQLMYAIRKNTVRDVFFHLMNYYHWRDSLQQILSRNSDKSLQSTHSAIVHRHCLQLRCRAVVQLSTVLKQDSSSDSLTQLAREALDTIPDFIAYTSWCMEKHAISLTFVDGYDIFAMILIFIYFSHDDGNSKMSLESMKVVVTAMDLLNSVADRFTAMKALRDVVWAYLTAVEESVTAAEKNGSADTGGKLLKELLATVAVPANLAAFMEESLQQPRT